MPTPKSIAVIPPRRGGNRRPIPAVQVAEDDAVISLGPLLVRPARRVQEQPRHRYHAGERLRLSSGGHVLARAGSVCKVLSLLPYEGHGALLYRVRSET